MEEHLGRPPCGDGIAGVGSGPGSTLLERRERFEAAKSFFKQLEDPRGSVSSTSHAR